MEKEYLLGYDIGTSSVKASLVDASTGITVASAQYPDTEAPIISHQAGWAEQDPEMWWTELRHATQRVAEKAGDTSALNAVRAIGISYQMHGLVCVDKDCNVLRPSIIWCDGRAVKYGNEAFDKIGPEQCLSHLLNSPGNFTAAKLAWVKENEPELFARIDKIMLPGDYIAMRLSGGDRKTRYRTHFVKAILDSNTGKTLEETQPEVMDVVEDKGETFDLVREGMLGMAQTIPALASYPHTIACKTGSPQRSEGYYAGSTYKHYTNAAMIAYGPAEDPEIAIGIVVEYGGAGARTGTLVADIFNAYYAMKDGTLTVDEAAAESLAQPETAADAAETPADGTADPAAGEAEDAGQNDAAAAPADAAATAGA